MKVASFALAAVASTAAAADCSTSTIVGALLPLALQITPCTTESGFDLMAAATSGKVPTATQLTAIQGSDACKTLYASLAKTLAGLSPPCTLGGVSTDKFATTPMDQAFTALLTLAGPGASSTNATKPSNATETNSTVTKPVTTAAAVTTAAPATTKPSSAAAASLSLAAVGLALYTAAQ
ncbi:Aste57867_14011 [Aphanomyces stellatus]|uniref:Aste57867_14011 protein n=1 Tax=Aphanomyces stellatus TaxID=120398 RepID=A0A485L0A4_9STRA|nr:hypothetical protein As57867_013960 [Aphanomyces stellatus]VFT90841.1 Aste57867_14011 [Aphanomyces stellatus]